MTGWLQELLVALGGGTVVLVGILTIFKGLFIKFVESGLESSFEKSVEKFKNKMERSNRAYEILLDREMRFYERIEPIIAELIPLEHDLLYYLKYDETIERKKQCEDFRKTFRRYCELIINLKNENLIHHTYVPQDIFNAFSDVVKNMQEDAQYWLDMAELLFAEKSEKNDYNKAQEKVNALLMCIASAEIKVKKRLQQLCGES